MFIDRVFNKVKGLVNTDGRGNFSPTRYNLAVHHAMTKRTEAYIYEVNRMVNRQNRGLINAGLENVPDHIREKINYLLKSDTISIPTGETKYSLPEDLLYFDTLLYSGTTEVEKCKDASDFMAITNCSSTTPTKQYPIFLQTGNEIEVAPSSITIPIKLYYLRKPAFPNWTYVMSGSEEMFNPDASDFVDIDLHPSEEENIVNEVLLFFGLNLKEPDIIQAATAIEAAETNLNNAS